jgi:hypothetical protein
MAGFSVSTQSPSTSAGTRPLGLIRRYSGVLCSPFASAIRTGS